jgi:hypothetical protein
MAYYRAACHFYGWVERRHIGKLADIDHVAAYIGALQQQSFRWKPLRQVF